MSKASSYYQISGKIHRRWPKMPNWFYLILIFVLALVILIATYNIGTVFLIILSELNWISGSNISQMSASSLTWLLIANFLPIFFGVAIVLRLLERRSLSSLGMQLKGSVQRYCRGLIIGLVLFGSCVTSMRLLGYAALEHSFNPTSFAGAFLVLIGWMVQGAAEEVLTRGFLMQIFGRISNTFMGILVSAFFFTGMHASNSGLNGLAIVNLVLFSIFTSIFTLYERGLWGVFAIHSVWNWAQGNLFGLEVSGHEIRSSIILDLKEVGPDFWTGGVYGLEGGGLVTITLAIAILWISIAYRRQLASVHTAN